MILFKFFYDIFRVNIIPKINSQIQPPPCHLNNFLIQFLQLILQESPEHPTVLNKPIFLDLIEHRISHKASSRIPSKGIKIGTGQVPLQLFFKNTRPHGKTICNGFPTCDNIRHNSRFLKRPESISSSPKTCLYLITYHDINLSPDRFQPLLRDFHISPDPLYRLQYE